MSDNPDRDKFVAKKVRVLTVACTTCRHRNRDLVTCAAFPGGIPEEILGGEHPHTRPFPGDNGIQYAPVS